VRILLLGATGSIGQQTLKIIRQLKYKLVGISFYENSTLATKIKTNYIYSPINKKLSNVKDYDELIKKSQPDLIVNAIVGFAGLEATLISIKNKIDVALANKESLVVAGQFIMKQAKQNKVCIFPIDSEHTSLYQIIKQIKRKPQHLIITASGGPFYNVSTDKLKKVSYAQAIHHPK
jgi:1-deoxy-D-xylulose-5-phosphate reductoisomerase